jgi:hypothetical protein
MWEEVPESDLSSILDFNSQKLVIVAFLDNPPTPLGEVQTWLDSLPWKHPNAVFLSITSHSQYKIPTHPTFVFFLKKREVLQVVGANRSELRDALKRLDRVTFCRDMLLEMGFPLRKVDAALVSTRNGTVDECVLYLEKIQVPPRPEPNNVRDSLLSMGFPASVVDLAITRVGGESVEQCLDEINRITSKSNQENPQDRIAKAQQQLKAKQAAEAAERAKSDAEAELRRRQEVQEANDLKARIARAKAENEAKLAQSQKAQDREVRQRVLQQINANKQAETRPPPESPVKSQASPGTKSPNAGSDAPCALQLVIDEEKTTIVGKFRAADTLRTVYEFIVEQVPGASKRTIAFETVIPRQRFESDHFDETLLDLKLTPRARVIVKYL